MERSGPTLVQEVPPPRDANFTRAVILVLLASDLPWDVTFPNGRKSHKYRTPTSGSADHTFHHRRSTPSSSHPIESIYHRALVTGFATIKMAKQRPSTAGRRERSSSATPTYQSSATQDRHSSRYADRNGHRNGRHGDRSDHHSRGDYDRSMPPESQFPAETAERQRREIGRLKRTVAQLFHTAPCTGALYIIGSLCILFLIGVAATAGLYGRSMTKVQTVQKVEDLDSLIEALEVIGHDKLASGYLWALLVFVGAAGCMGIYLAVVIFYQAIINESGLYLWMKRAEVKNEGDRDAVKARRYAKGVRMQEMNAPGTR